jgi:endonuclease G
LAALEAAACAAPATTPALAIVAHRPEAPFAASPHLALGTPTDSDPSDDLIVDHQVFVVSYNPRRMTANWVAWRLVAQDLGPVQRRNDFHPDPLLPRDVFHVRPRDYGGSGYDRGHLCPSGDRTSAQDTNWETFVMTNMQPQRPGLNRGPWAVLERYEREVAARHDKQVFIVAGGLFDVGAPAIGPGIAVPRASFKVLVILDRGLGAADVTEATSSVAVIMPNVASVTGTPWEDYLVSVDEVERQSGYDLLSRVPEAVQRALEARSRQ